MELRPDEISTIIKQQITNYQSQIKLTNDSREGKRLEVKEGTGFAQGIFLEYGITVDDETTEERNGGFGSTTR